MDQDKVDLSSVNKTKKQFSLPRLKNPFKKQAGPSRDQEGKFTTGSGGLINTKHFNWKRAAPLMIVVALVGGFFVYRSFAAVPSTYGGVLYDYQFSAGPYSTCGYINTTGFKNQKCANLSAEALTFRYYRGLLNRNPDTGGYKYWTQQLAGARMQPSSVAEKMLSSSTSTKAQSNQQFITSLYQQLMGRAPDTGGLAYWVKQLDSNSWSRARVAAHFATSNEAITKQTNAFNAYFKTAPLVTITQTAITAQQNRANSIREYRNKISNEILKDIQASAAKIAEQRRIAYNTDGVVTREKYNIIVKAEADARPWYQKIQNQEALAKDYVKKSKAIAAEAARIKAYSPDISDANVKSELGTVEFYAESVTSNREDAWLNGLNTIIERRQSYEKLL